MKKIICMAIILVIFLTGSYFIFNNDKKEPGLKKLTVAEVAHTIFYAPMVCLFVGYLIIPLVFIGLTSMSSSFSSMTATKAK